MSARKFNLRDMTSAEFRLRMAEAPVILLPFGSQEVQGPHAPMGDFMLTEALAEMVAREADAIAAPTMPFGHADFFRAIPGGIQLRPQTFIAAVEDIAGGFLDHGLERLVILNGHTTNAPLIDQAVRGLRRARGVAVPSINIWQGVAPAMWETLHGADAARARGHGGDPLTSIYMHLFPDLMRPDLAAKSAPGKAFGLPTAGVSAVAFGDLSVQVPLNVDEVDANGMMGGDVSLSSPAIGAALVAHIVSRVSAFVRHFRACDPRCMSSAP